MYALNSNPAIATINPTDAAKQYNDCARDYDEKYKAVLGWDPVEYFVPHIKKFVLDRNASFLDVGCGTGALAKGLREAGFHGDIDGFDLSSEMVNICKEKSVFCDVYVHDMYDPFPIRDGGYDVVITTAALLFVQKEDLMLEFLRSVKPGGHLLIASRQDRMKSFGYAQHLKALVEEKVLAQLLFEIRPLCGVREEYQKDDFLYQTYIFRKTRKEDNIDDGKVAKRMRIEK